MEAAVVVTLLGGLGLFLLGIHHLTEGMKGLAGDSLRRALQRLVAGRFSAVACGAFFTAVIQSSTAAILTVIGFVSAGLVSFTQAVGMIVGATLGTTSTIWMVAIFGLRLRIATAALPMLGIGAFLWLVARGKTRSLGAILAGFGLIFTGIDYLQTGMEGIEWNVEAFAGSGWASLWILSGIGILMSIVMQSSTAAGATTLVALNAGSVDFEQACAMIVGQSIGTAATTALLVVGGSLAVRRSALAHIVYSVVAGVLAMIFIVPLAAASEWVGLRLDDYEGVLSLATFSSLFKLAGIVAIYPFLDGFSRLIARLAGGGSESAVSRLEPALAEAGAPVVFEAAWRALLEVSRGAVDAVRARLAGEEVPKGTAGDAVPQIEHFLESLPLETTDLGELGPRLVRLFHALDHLTELNEDLAQVPPVARDGQPPASFGAGATALAGWLAVAKEGSAAPVAGVFEALEAAAAQLAAERKTAREAILEDVALKRTSTAAARTQLDALAWAERSLHHAWRLVESLRVAASR